MSIGLAAVSDRSALRPRTMYLLYITAHAIRSEMEQALRPHGLTGIQYSIMGMLESNGGMSSAAVSRRFFVTPQTMNQTIQAMVQQGWIDRQRDPTNARVLILTLTVEGRRLMALADALADQIEEQSFAVLDDAELAMLRKLLSRTFDAKITGKPGAERR